jgi:ATP-dependent Clp protease ATP-binding subunit ClpC
MKQAAAREHEEVTPEHVLLAIATYAKRKVAHVVLEGLGVELLGYASKIAALLPDAGTAQPREDQSYNKQTVRMLSEANAESMELHHSWIGSEHLVLGLLRCGSCPAGEFLREKGVTPERFRAELLKVLAH